MDNLTHTLAGLAMGEAGLRHRTGRATATLVIGANLPDLDGLFYLFGSGTDALAFRRGWTHGILAMVVLPVGLTAAMLLFDRWRRRSTDGLPPVSPRQLLLLAALATWSHPLLDWLNVYGVRLLMPFSDRWFYGDALFIVDPWVWLLLATSVAWSRRATRRGVSAATLRPARIGTALSLGYLALMIGSSRIGAAVVAAQGEGTAARVVISPVPVDPLRREVVRQLDDDYELGELQFGWPTRYRVRERLPLGADVPGATTAAATRPGRKFLAWARLPRFQSWPAGDSIQVLLSDMRYGTGREASFATADITVPARRQRRSPP